MTPRGAFLLLVALALAALLIFGGGDVMMAHVLRGVPPWAKSAASWVSLAGEPTVYLGAAAFAAGFYRLVRRDDGRCRGALLILAAIALSGILVNLLKFLFGRTRPGMLYDHGIAEFMGPTFDSAIRSFPSGHAATVGAITGLVFLLAPRWRGAAIAFAIAVGLSRLLVGYHFVSDVIAGLAVGWLSVVLARLGFARWGWWPNAHRVQAPDAGPRPRSSGAIS